MVPHLRRILYPPGGGAGVESYTPNGILTFKLDFSCPNNEAEYKALVVRLTSTTNFIRDGVICHFGIPKRIISGSGIPFVNSYFSC